ncbi:cation:proton antiporter [Methanofervidicoccus sp. A16]|uniref:cation:proton antiporter n=1 Tax=Methanofervidicoccus sp. A16 TaxID=2607662 RepID=UPI00118C8815|nr:cation:proton antiporter [Methanofervidicoccus sp. A16]AXI25554.1 cation:proton antiporter [Methanofervidicoccus sp. A16]
MYVPIKEIVLLIASIGILLASYRLWIMKDGKNMVYARIHIAGVIDLACILIMLVLNRPLLALLYLILSPFAAHAIANADYYDRMRERVVKRLRC